MALSRRMILTSGTAAAAVTLVGGWGALSSPSLAKASAPWGMAGQGFADPRLSALSYAILAPNPHNRQPWRFALVGEDRIDIFCDLDKRLPSTDPFDRQITIGFGCMIELLRQASAELGFSVEIEAFPDGEGQPRLDERPIARVTLQADRPVKDPLFQNALDRRSTKEPFTQQAVAASEISGLTQAVDGPVQFGASETPMQLQALSENAWKAWQIEQETPATRRERIELMRFGNAEVVAQPDGIDMGGAFLSAAHTFGILTPEALDTPGSSAYTQGFDMYRALVDTTPRWVWLKTKGNSRTDQLAAGRSWVRLNLAAQARGLAVHPWSHALQEFPEMRAAYEELRGLIAPDGSTVQMFARLGYGPEVTASPRWPLETKLLDA